jgi:hypothetical protein
VGAQAGVYVYMCMCVGGGTGGGDVSSEAGAATPEMSISSVGSQY